MGKQAKRPSIRERLPRDILRMTELRPGEVMFYLRNDYWREDLADALAIVTIAEEGDDVTLMVRSKSRRVMLEISLEIARLERPTIVVGRR
jgi:hypothetical protein